MAGTGGFDLPTVGGDPWMEEFRRSMKEAMANFFAATDIWRTPPSTTRDIVHLPVSDQDFMMTIDNTSTTNSSTSKARRNHPPLPSNRLRST
jgi:hypothetical protein